MTFIITGGCCNDSSCIPVCPVQCIRPRPGDPDFTTSAQLYIDPKTCIDCAACVDQCPVDSIYAEWELPDVLSEYAQINADYFELSPIMPSAPSPPIRRLLPHDSPTLRVAVVGSGPAGAYATAELTAIPGVHVTLLERLPTPGGLIRAGVAPDHPTTKQIGDRFGKVIRRANVDCFFNVEVGRDVTIEELLAHHHAVLWAGGAPADRSLGIPGEDLPGSVAAREFVAWYNGHPDHVGHQYDFDTDRVVVIGNGNVAVDVARILSLPIQLLAATDMAEHAITALRGATVREIAMTARRGPEHAACTLAEVIGLGQCESVSLTTHRDEVEHLAAKRHDRRAQALLEASRTRADPADRRIVMRFGLVPTSINGTDRVESVTFAKPDGSFETLEARLVIRAVGYAGVPVAGLPFDDTSATLPHVAGSVVDPDSTEPVLGVYCSGWIKRGPTGMIGTNRTDSAETVDTILHDFAAGRLTDPTGSLTEIHSLIRTRQPDVVDKHGWKRIDTAERARGTAKNRPRVKSVHWAELVALAQPVTGPRPGG